MIKYSDAELTSVLPPYMKNNSDVQAISYACKMAMQKMIQFSSLTSLYANIDNLVPELLDLMALELGTQYYDEDMPVNTKRKLIKNTLAWYKKAGTPSAVKELIEVVFGEGEIVEWFNYTEPPYTPHTFEIVTDATVTEEAIEYFLSVIKKVKNTRSHLRNIQSKRRIDAVWFAGPGAVSTPHRYIVSGQEKGRATQGQSNAAAGLISVPKRTIENNKGIMPVNSWGRRWVATALVICPKVIIENNKELCPADITGNSFLAGANHFGGKAVVLNEIHNHNEKHQLRQVATGVIFNPKTII